MLTGRERTSGKQADKEVLPPSHRMFNCQVHIFGLNHFHQNIQSVCFTPAGKADEQNQKAGLRAVLSEIVAKNRVDLIAVEGRPDRACLGKALADEHHTAYMDITMPLDERERRGIRTPEYDRQPAARAEAYKHFEQYMFQQVNAQRARVVLVMCGRRHFRVLGQLFQNSGDDIRLYDINDYEWYRGRPVEGAEGVIDYDKED